MRRSGPCGFRFLVTPSKACRCDRPPAWENPGTPAAGPDFPQQPLRHQPGAQGIGLPGHRRRRSLPERLIYFHEHQKLIEAQRIGERTRFDLEMMKELGYCHGIENYSRHLTGRMAGQPPPTLLEYFPQDFLLSSTRVIWRFPSSRACTGATAPASRPWWTTGSGCPRPWTTGP